MALTSEDLTKNVAIKAALAGLRLARPATGSRTLSDSMNIRRGKFTTRRSVHRVEVPHYWAVFKHDGTGI